MCGTSRRHGNISFVDILAAWAAILPVCRIPGVWNLNFFKPAHVRAELKSILQRALWKYQSVSFMNTIILSLRGSKKAARVSLARAVKDLLNAARLTGRMSGEGRFLPSSILFSKLFPL